MARSDTRVVLGICGSIAAYKSCEMVRVLRQGGAEVRCVLTPAASKFVTPFSLSVLSGSPVYEDLWDSNLWDIAHLSLANWAHLVLIAPATADFISRLASGRAEGLLDSLILSLPHCAGRPQELQPGTIVPKTLSGRRLKGMDDGKSRVIVCPAMEECMWLHPATQANVQRLKEYGYQVWGPQKGSLASGRFGWGRLMEPPEIARRIFEQQKQGRQGKQR